MTYSIGQIKEGVNYPEKAFHHVYNRLIDPVYRPVALTASSRHPRATNVYELDWDLLIILDSCRVDALREVASKGNYSFLNPDHIENMVSVGGSTLEWTAATFRKEWSDEIQDTAFISSNGHPYRILWEGFDVREHYSASLARPNWNTVDGEKLGEHIFAWQYTERGYARQANAEIVRDLAIKTGRNTSCERVIAHFIEPHYPYVAAPKRLGVEEPTFAEGPPWNYLRKGGDRDIVWEHYLAELEHALDHVEDLLRNFDAENVLITADHGEAFGEYGCYGHNGGAILPRIRRVPVTESTAIDEKTITPEIPAPNKDSDVTEHLRSLGYL